MDQETLNAHYKKLAARYDAAFTSKTQSKGYSFMGEEGARQIMDWMKLDKEDKLVDLAAGTCVTAGMGLYQVIFNVQTSVSGQLSRLASLTKPVLCVEPVQEMLDVALKNNVANIEMMCATAEEFVRRDINYDKLLIKGSVHHFPRDQLQEIFGGIHGQLNDNGIVLIEKVSSNKVKSRQRLCYSLKFIKVYS